LKLAVLEMGVAGGLFVPKIMSIEAQSGPAAIAAVAAQK
jgi:hypothetical protein